MRVKPRYIRLLLHDMEIGAGMGARRRKKVKARKVPGIAAQSREGGAAGGRESGAAGVASQTPKRRKKGKKKQRRAEREYACDADAEEFLKTHQVSSFLPPAPLNMQCCSTKGAGVRRRRAPYPCSMHPQPKTSNPKT